MPLSLRGAVVSNGLVYGKLLYALAFLVYQFQQFNYLLFAYIFRFVHFDMPHRFAAALKKGYFFPVKPHDGKPQVDVVSKRTDVKFTVTKYGDTPSHFLFYSGNSF